jgi:uncharacterized protein (TIGR03083 family)
VRNQHVSRLGSMTDPINAVVNQWRRNAECVMGLRAEDFMRPTRLGSWRIAELIAHLTSTMAMVVELGESPAPSTAIGQVIDWYANSEEFATTIAEQARRAARASPENLRRAHVHTMEAAIFLVMHTVPSRPVAAGADGLTLEQLCVTRCVEAVIHGLDLAAGLHRDADIDQGALDVCVRYVTVALARSSRPPLARILVGDSASDSTWVVDWGPAPAISPPPYCPSLTFLELVTGRTDLDQTELASLDSKARNSLAGLLPILK